MAEQVTLKPPLPASRKGERKSISRITAVVPLCFFALLTVYSCSEESKSVMGNIDPETFPTMMTLNVSTLVSDSGYTRYHVTADQWLMFDEAKDPFWTFPDGLYMEKYDDSMRVESTFRSDSASYLSQKRIWRFDRNVRMKNIDGDRFATEQLFWDQQQQKVYSDSFIHIERTDRILEGYGFESNEQMTEYTILNVSGIFPTPQRNEHKKDSLATSQADSTVTETIPANTMQVKEEEVTDDSKPVIQPKPRARRPSRGDSVRPARNRIVDNRELK